MEHTTASDKILERLKSGCRAKSDSELANMLGVSQQSISSARSKDKVPDSWIRIAAERFNLSTDWLFFGHDTIKIGESAPELSVSRRKNDVSRIVEGTKVKTFDCDNTEYSLVPMVDAVLSAGQGSLETSGEYTQHYSFRTQFLNRKGQISKMVLMRVDGDSMEPTISNRDVVLIDQSQTNIRSGKIYAVGIEDAIYLKELNTKPGEMILTSHNKEYEPIIIHLREEQTSHIRIIGRALWWCREA